MKKYLAALPLTVWMTLFVGCPLLYIFVLSFLTRGPTGGVVFQFTLNNYTRLLEPMYLQIFLRSMGIAVVTSVVTLILGYPFAYFLSQSTQRKKSFLLLLMMIPFWTNSLLRTYGFIILLRKDGALNNILLALNIFEKPMTFLYNYPSIISGMVYMLLPFMILPVFNSLEKLDHSLLEAAKDLGASKLRTFLTVTLPLSLPGVISGAILVFILAVGLFFISDLLGGAKTILIGNLIQLQMTSARDWPFGAAISVILMIGIAVFMKIYSKIISAGGNSGIGGSFFE